MIKSNNIASFAVDLIVETGSSTVFTLTGGMAMHINRAVAKHKTLKAVYCHHEQACVAAAEGFCKTKNFQNAGFAVVTAGPGVSNTLTSLISAYGDSTPVIVLAGQIKTQDIDTQGLRMHGIQEVKSKKIISPVVKKFSRLTASNYKKEVMETIIAAYSGRPGPVFIEIPLDIQAVKLSYNDSDIKKLAKLIKNKLNKDEIYDNYLFKQAIQKITSAKKPLLYIGNGCRIAGMHEEIIRFAKHNNIPCVFSWLSFDNLSASDNLNMGCPGGLAPIYSNQILSRADVILFLGTRLDLGTTAFQIENFGDQAERYVIDIDRSELDKFSNKLKLIKIHADLKGFRKNAKYKKTDKNKNRSWVMECCNLRAIYFKEESKRLNSTKLSVYKVASLFSSLSKNKVFVPASSGYAEETFTRFFRPQTNTRFFNGAALGSMGLGLPHAIGASCATNKQVICLEADGGIMLNIQELATLITLRPKNLIIVVLNNNGYESIRSSQNRHFGEIYGVDGESGLGFPNFKNISKAFNLKYLQIKTLADFPKLRRILSKIKSMTLIDIVIPKYENRGPTVKTVFDALGRPSTTSLKELNW